MPALALATVAPSTRQARGQSSNYVEGLHGTGLKRLSGFRRRFLDEGRELLDLLIEHFELFARVGGRQLEEFPTATLRPSVAERNRRPHSYSRVRPQ